MKKIVLAIMLIGIIGIVFAQNPLPPDTMVLCEVTTTKPLAITIAKPVTGTYDNSIEITWTTNYDNTICYDGANIYYDNDNAAGGETKITDQKIAGNSFTWNTTGIPNKNYYIKIIVEASTKTATIQSNGEITTNLPDLEETKSAYSNQITIQHPATTINALQPSATALQSIPTLINLHLFVTDKTTGKALNSTKDISAKLYKSATEIIWDDTFANNQIVNGNTNILLGSGTKSLAADFSKPIWIELTIGTETLSPKFLLTPTAYAINSYHAEYTKKSDQSNSSKYAERALNAVYAQRSANSTTSDKANYASTAGSVLTVAGKNVFWDETNPANPKLCYNTGATQSTCHAQAKPFSKCGEAALSGTQTTDSALTQAEALAFCKKQLACNSSIDKEKVYFNNYDSIRSNCEYTITTLVPLTGTWTGEIFCSLSEDVKYWETASTKCTTFN